MVSTAMVCGVKRVHKLEPDVIRRPMRSYSEHSIDKNLITFARGPESRSYGIED